MNISFEIVPRSLEVFDQQYSFVQSLNPGINIINVPDIQHFTTRSWALSDRIDRNKFRFIPHFRAIDFSIESGELCRIIDDYQLDNVLLVTGDPPEGLKRAYYNTDVVDLIRSLRHYYPKLNIYAGFDPHRNGLQQECDYIQRKVDAGAGGFFSQPFYDSRMIEIYAEQMTGLETYIGISPITSTASMNYWEVKNKVKFPSGFRPDYQWNVAFANNLIDSIIASKLNIYFMPIRVDLQRYFKSVLINRFKNC
ncbi:methylenetetrahydrofolate reductase [Methylomonas paludis]|uniref:Methylenetetrahydrofolate reductase n=1 Tax=Methylomonas paludis TaxID=1173101 RepID=A0A975MNV5_9GAMM|nr:methylenetetrahydrofolate reductase [Methylomonas paludis]QWF71303.1 methylenetetrahydrofolate reductase [Methylomonas paludis]